MSERRSLTVQGKYGNEMLVEAKIEADEIVFEIESHTYIVTVTLTKAKAMGLGRWLLTNAAEMEDD